MASVPLDLEADIQPISDFRSNTASILKQVQDTRRPIVVTQNGRSAAVLVDVRSYQDLLEEIETLRELLASRASHDAGRTHSHADARRILKDRFGAR
jgi:prevent-host-death family protein